MPVQQCREGTFAVFPVVLQNYESSILKKKSAYGNHGDLFVFKQKVVGSFCSMLSFWLLNMHANHTSKHLCVPRKAKNFFLIET